MFQFETVLSLALRELLLVVFAVVALTLLAAVLVEISCLFCALISQRLDEPDQRRTRHA